MKSYLINFTNHTEKDCTLICTTCGIFTDHLYGEKWNNKLGYIIKPGEELCNNCADKRRGFMYAGTLLTKLNNERKK